MTQSGKFFSRQDILFATSSVQQLQNTIEELLCWLTITAVGFICLVPYTECLGPSRKLAISTVRFSSQLCY